MQDLAELLGCASGFTFACAMAATEPLSKVLIALLCIALTLAWRKVGKLAKRTSQEPHP